MAEEIKRKSGGKGKKVTNAKKLESGPQYARGAAVATIVILVAIAVSNLKPDAYDCLLQMFMGPNVHEKSDSSGSTDLRGGWKLDPAFDLSVANVTCDLPIIDVRAIDPKKIHEIDFKNEAIIIRGLTNRWPALDKWQRQNITRLYGSRQILTGSQSSIVYGGGAAGVPTTLNSMLEKMHNSSDSSTDFFAFDVSILKSIPDLGKDFSIPIMFQDWDNQENERQGYSWHMLSLGASKTGLPFHMHGETWLSLIYGKKRWFIYPPGYSPPLATSSFNPLRTVFNWVTEVRKLAYFTLSSYCFLLCAFFTLSSILQCAAAAAIPGVLS